MIITLVFIFYFSCLYNSNGFSFMANKKIYSRLMGCDYYIDNNLYIYYNDNNNSFINLDRKSGYFNIIEEGYIDDANEVTMDDYKKNILETKIIPILIYNNNTFHNLSFQKKYKNIIEQNIKDYGKEWKDIKEIVKKEERYKI